MTRELCFMKTYCTMFQDSMDNGSEELDDNLRSWTVLAVLQCTLRSTHINVQRKQCAHQCAPTASRVWLISDKTRACKSHTVINLDTDQFCPAAVGCGLQGQEQKSSSAYEQSHDNDPHTLSLVSAHYIQQKIPQYILTALASKCIL